MKIRVSSASVLLAFLLVSAWIVPSDSEASENPWAFLPTRAAPAEGGSITFQAGARCERDTKQFHMLFRRHPLQYFLVVTNESKSPIWVTAELQLPEEKTQKFEGDLAPQKNGIFFWRSTGLAAGKPIPLRISIHADAARTRVVTVKDTSMTFPERDKESFEGAIYDAMSKAQFSNQRQCPVISGWQDMKNFEAAVPGSAADAKLQSDIKLLLWKEQSRDNWECTHEILKAEPLSSPSDAFAAGWPDDLKARVEKARAEGGAIFEKWAIKSCDASAVYEVMMMKSGKGGTNVLARKVSEVEVK